MYRRHRKNDLLNVIIGSILEDGWQLIYENTTTEHPFELTVFKGDDSYRLRIYIWNLTHGGGSNRPDNEYRVQFTSTEELVSSSNITTLILGYWSENGTIAAWDINKHSGQLGSSSSAQVKREALENAHIHGFGTYFKSSTEETVIAFQPHLLMEYVKRREELHLITSSSENETYFNENIHSTEVNDADTVNNTDRDTVILKVRKKIRDSSFRRRILTTYNNQCAMCSVQLKLIDAAHILPVAHSGSDLNDNGVALCSLHHKAYDSHLVTFDEGYNILVSEKKLREFRRMNVSYGFEKFSSDLRPMINLPPTLSDRPNINNIRLANRLRGWNN